MRITIAILVLSHLSCSACMQFQMLRRQFNTIQIPSTGLKQVGSSISYSTNLGGSSGGGGGSSLLVDNMAFRLTATNVANGAVSSWVDVIRGMAFNQANASLQPSKGSVPPINGVYFNRADSEFLQAASSFTVNQTADAQNDYAVYCIFKPVSTPSGVYHGLWSTVSGSTTVQLHPSMTVNVSSDDIYGTATVNAINVFVANEGYHNTNRGRWMNNVTNSTSTQAYSAAVRAFEIEKVGHTSSTYYWDGAIYEIGVWTNKIVTATEATALYNYAIATYQ